MAHKQGQGSSKNGRDSKPKYLGIKRYAGEFVTVGSIIVRQRGTVFNPGRNVGLGKDYTIFAKEEGIVRFESTKRKRIHVIPITEVLAEKAAKPAATKSLPSDLGAN